MITWSKFILMQTCLLIELNLIFHLFINANPKYLKHDSNFLYLNQYTYFIPIKGVNLRGWPLNELLAII